MNAIPRLRLGRRSSSPLTRSDALHVAHRIDLAASTPTPRRPTGGRPASDHRREDFLPIWGAEIPKLPANACVVETNSHYSGLISLRTNSPRWGHDKARPVPFASSLPRRFGSPGATPPPPRVAAAAVPAMLAEGFEFLPIVRRNTRFGSSCRRHHNEIGGSLPETSETPRAWRASQLADH